MFLRVKALLPNPLYACTISYAHDKESALLRAERGKHQFRPSHLPASPSIRQEDTEHARKSDGVLLLQVRFTRKLFREHLDHELFMNLIQFFQCRLQHKPIFEGAFAEKICKLKGAPPYKQFGIFDLPAVSGQSCANIL